MLATFIAAACLAVPGPNITARDLARAVPGFSPSDPDAVVGYAPSPGVERIFYAAELRQSLIRLHYEPAEELANVCFTRPVAPIRPEDVIAAMKRTLGGDARIDVLEVSRFPAPAGDLVFPPEQLAAPPIAIWRGYVSYDGNRRFPMWARVQISMKMLRAKSLEPLRPGVAVKASQIMFEKIEGFPDLRATPQSLKTVEGYLPKRFIGANEPVWNDAIDPPYDVTKGDRATVMVRSGQAQLSFDAEAQASGRRGDQVSFKNPESGRLFRARVEGPGKAAIETSPVNK